MNINFPLPRILFFKPDGTFLKDIINTDGNPKFKLVLLFMKQHPIYSWVADQKLTDNTTTLLDRYYHYSAHSVADCMEDVTLLEPTWQEEKNSDENIEKEDQTEEKDDLDVKDELWSPPKVQSACGRVCWSGAQSS